MDEFRFPCVGGVDYGFRERQQFYEMAVLGFLGFLIPFVFGHPQFFVGAVVNALLIRSALTLPMRKLLPVAVAPSLGALARGVLFGPFTVYLIVLAPFIWAGNLLLIRVFQSRLRGISYGVTLLTGSLAKAGLLYAAAYSLYSLGLIPEVLLPSMGLMQFSTAVAGGFALYLFLRR